MSLKIENLTVNGEKVPSGDPKNKLFSVGDPSKGQNQGMIYMDESIAAEYICEKAELDVVLTYQNSNASAMVKKQVRRFHLSKQCAISTTTQKVQVKLYDWCAPVSYTHLDVYKRQVQEKGRNVHLLLQIFAVHEKLLLSLIHI